MPSGFLCPKCHGQRTTGCLVCAGTGKRSFAGISIGACKECKGSGRQRCNVCGGSGEVEREVELNHAHGDKKTMTGLHALAAGIALGMAAQMLPAAAEERIPQSGAYEITARLELPHLERWAIDKTMVACLPSARTEDKLLIPIVSANNPFAKCSSANLVMQSEKLEYDIICPERGAAKGHAIYTVSADAFSGRVAMVMGAKNMTMTEVQHGRRIGNCGPLPAVSATLN
jgi:hypothetical protein